MDVNNLIFIVGFVVALSLFFFLAIWLRERFWRLFGAGLPFLLGGIFLFNIISFGLINRPYFNWAYEGVLQRLPSNGLIDLYATSGTPIRTEWIYAVIENYYQGQTISIPRDVLETLDLSLDQLESQGQLGAVNLSEGDWDLSSDDLEVILDLEPGILQTWILDDMNNITQDAGDIYHFVLDPTGLESPVFLLRSDNKIIFLPESILPDLEGEN